SPRPAGPRAQAQERGSSRIFFGLCHDPCSGAKGVISLANTAATKILAALTAPTGLNSGIAALAQTANVSLGPISNAQLFTGQISSDIAEKAGDVKYTAVYVYCDKITNTLKEKFRSF